MGLGIIIPLIVLPIMLIGAYAWYRRSIADMKPTDTKPVSGLRLTAESLHRMPSPPWRIVYEINDALGGVDHIVIGHAGVVAITTVVADRPATAQLLDARGEAALVAEAAVARGPIDELLRPVGMSCARSARVFWGTPDRDRAPAEQLVHASQLVEGQRIAEWLGSLTPTEVPLDPTRVDLAWQAIVMGIGRPDPLR